MIGKPAFAILGLVQVEELLSRERLGYFLHAHPVLRKRHPSNGVIESACGSRRHATFSVPALPMNANALPRTQARRSVEAN